MPDRQRLRGLFEIGRHRLRETGRSASRRDGHIVETLAFATAGGEAVRGLLLKPAGAGKPLPAILHIHAHGNRHEIGADEMLEGRPALQSAPGPAFAGLGLATLCIDLPCFGHRSNAIESACAKAALWRGQSLAGQMLGELSSAIDWLAAQADIDANRIGCFGISMGATLGYWLAAVDERVAAVAHQCCLADFETLISTGAHDLHGIYLAVPGLLGAASNGEIAGMIAPRPQLACIGDLDPLTPPASTALVLRQIEDAYGRANAARCFTVVRDADCGHRETPDMREATLRFFRDHLVLPAGTREPPESNRSR
jgi:dienelactone hydrolase